MSWNALSRAVNLAFHELLSFGDCARFIEYKCSEACIIPLQRIGKRWLNSMARHFREVLALLIAIPHRSCIRLMSAVTPLLPHLGPHLQSTVLTIDVVISTSDATIEFLHIDKPVSDVSLCQVGRSDFQG